MLKILWILINNIRIMYNIFNQTYFPTGNTSLDPNTDLIKRVYTILLNSIIKYYQTRVMTVKNNHLLCKIINTGFIPITYDGDRFTEIAYSRSPYIAKHFNLTSPINYGKIFKEIFYLDCNEIILFDDSDFIHDEVIRNWQYVSAVKVLNHPFSNTSFLLPSGNSSFIDNKESYTNLGTNSTYTDKGLVTISVNIALLLTQYKGFLLSNINNSQINLSIPNFVHMYVLPNMLYSHTELVLLNRLMNIFYGSPMGIAYKKHPFSIINYDRKLDSILNYSIKRLKDSTGSFQNMLSNIPSIFNRNMLESLYMPDMARTKQVWWALLLSRINVMKFLLDISNDRSLSTNRSYINALKIDIKNIQRDSTFKLMLSKDIEENTITTFIEILSI